MTEKLKNFSETLQAFALKRLQEEGDARIPRGWKTCGVYERLIERGVAVEIADPNPLLRRFAAVSNGQLTPVEMSVGKPRDAR